MPYFYHVSLSFHPSGLETDAVKGDVYFSKKDSYWNKIVKDHGLRDFRGYREYRLNIPKSDITESLNPNKTNQILFLNKKNPEHRKILKKFYHKGFAREEFHKFLIKRGFNGVNYHSVARFFNNILDIEPEIVIFDIRKYIDRLELVYMVFNGYDKPVKVNKLKKKSKKD